MEYFQIWCWPTASLNHNRLTSSIAYGDAEFADSKSVIYICARKSRSNWKGYGNLVWLRCSTNITFKTSPNRSFPEKKKDRCYLQKYAEALPDVWEMHAGGMGRNTSDQLISILIVLTDLLYLEHMILWLDFDIEL